MDSLLPRTESGGRFSVRYDREEGVECLDSRLFTRVIEESCGRKVEEEYEEFLQEGVRVIMVSARSGRARLHFGCVSLELAPAKYNFCKMSEEIISL